MTKTTYEIDGNAFDCFEGFVSHFKEVFPYRHWNRNLNAFDDILRGGFGTPDDGFRIVWKDHKRSRELLGSDFTLLLDIILVHGEGGDEQQDKVVLSLE